MHKKTYVRPIGLTPNIASDHIGHVPGMRSLAQGWLCYSGLQVFIRRGTEVEQRCIFFGEESEFEQALDTLHLTELDSRVQAPREPIAGLQLFRPHIMGIVNVTPDSFSDGGQFATPQQAIDHALRLDEAGASILDIGGESTRPGSETISVDEELRRVMPVIEGLVGRTRAKLSIDTQKSEVIRRAVEAGVHVINDISALTNDPESLHVASESGLPVVLMHKQNTPKTMQVNPTYENALLDIYDALEERILICEQAGLPRSRLIVDPGIGFGKTLTHNLELLSGLSMFHGLGVPLLLGASRKSFIGKLSGEADPKKRLPGSIAAALAGIAQGVHIIRVHDVAETHQALSVWQSVNFGTNHALISDA